MTGNAELLDQAEGREDFRMIKENFGKDFFVKQIQTPWPEPNEIDQEYCDRDQDDCSNRAEPFENAFKHLLYIGVENAHDDLMRDAHQTDSTFRYKSMIPGFAVISAARSVHQRFSALWLNLVICFRQIHYSVSAYRSKAL